MFSLYILGFVTDRNSATQALSTLDSKTSTCKALQSSAAGKYPEPHAVNKNIHTKRLWPGPEIDNITANTCFPQVASNLEDL